MKIDAAKTKVVFWTQSYQYSSHCPEWYAAWGSRPVPVFGTSIHPARPKQRWKAKAAFGHLQHCLWSRSEIRRSSKCRIYQILVRSILLYGCEPWTVRNYDLHVAEVFDRQCLRRILWIRLLDRVSNDDLLHRVDLHLQSVNGALLSRRLKWFGHALRRPPETLIRSIISPLPPAHWRKCCGGQMKTWLSTVKTDMARITGPDVFGLRGWNKEWLSITSTDASDRHSWSATIREAVNQIGREDQTHVGWAP